MSLIEPRLSKGYTSGSCAATLGLVELLGEVLRYCPPDTLASAAQVSKCWRITISEWTDFGKTAIWRPRGSSHQRFATALRVQHRQGSYAYIEGLPPPCTPCGRQLLDLLRTRGSRITSLCVIMSEDKRWDSITLEALIDVISHTMSDLHILSISDSIKRRKVAHMPAGWSLMAFLLGCKQLYCMQLNLVGLYSSSLGNNALVTSQLRSIDIVCPAFLPRQLCCLPLWHEKYCADGGVFAIRVSGDEGWAFTSWEMNATANLILCDDWISCDWLGAADTQPGVIRRILLPASHRYARWAVQCLSDFSNLVVLSIPTPFWSQCAIHEPTPCTMTALQALHIQTALFASPNGLLHPFLSTNFAIATVVQLVCPELTHIALERAATDLQLAGESGRVMIQNAAYPVDEAEDFFAVAIRSEQAYTLTILDTVPSTEWLHFYGTSRSPRAIGHSSTTGLQGWLGRAGKHGSLDETSSATPTPQFTAHCEFDTVISLDDVNVMRPIQRAFKNSDTVEHRIGD
ncbi:hypothetical protein BKA62DRAFT_676957 [Auriculariales sp. MPI-PUGE-AT-0066]|nr:hypothetical protein BKA62DRAFT_676957 [Auriculariales sp. MPI-PUGE-AT-0066]